jgi:hypothetical protein
MVDHALKRAHEFFGPVLRRALYEFRLFHMFRQGTISPGFAVFPHEIWAGRAFSGGPPLYNFGFILL